MGTWDNAFSALLYDMLYNEVWKLNVKKSALALTHALTWETHERSGVESSVSRFRLYEELAFNISV